MKRQNRLTRTIAAALVVLGLSYPVYAALTNVASITLTIDSTLTNSGLLTNTTDRINQGYILNLASGTGAGQASNAFRDQRTLAASGTEDLDLAGVLTNAVGQTITFTKLKVLIIHAAAGNTNNVNVTMPVSNGAPIFLAAGDGVGIRPNGTYVFTAPTAAGITITAATGDLVTITNSAGTTGVTYDVVALGS
jgi:hypothetical protein